MTYLRIYLKWSSWRKMAFRIEFGTSDLITEKNDKVLTEEFKKEKKEERSEIQVGDCNMFTELITTTHAILKIINELQTLLEKKGMFKSNNQEAYNSLKSLKERFKDFTTNLGTLAIDLQQLSSLKIMASEWNSRADKLPVSTNISTLTDKEIQEIRKETLEFLLNAKNASFYSTYSTQGLNKFQSLKDPFAAFQTHLENTLKTIQAATVNTKACKQLWPNIQTNFLNLKEAGQQANSAISSVHDSLIKAIKDASTITQ